MSINEGFDAATGLTPALAVAGSSDGVAIEAVNFYGNTTVTINTSTIDGNVYRYSKQC